jgi:quercetin dioxygenase-like cupin family protein
MQFDIQKLDDAKVILADPVGKMMFGDDRVNVIHMELKPYQKIKYHLNTHDVLFYVLEGEGVVEIEDKSQKMEKDSSIFIKGGLLRAWSNKTNNTLRLLVVKMMHDIGNKFSTKA